MSQTAAEAEAVATPLDLILTSAAVGPLKRLMPNSSWARFGRGLATRPGTVARRTASLAAELSGVVAGTSQRTPSARDRRFADVAWTDNPLLHRSVQAYLATAETARALLDDAQLGPRDRERMQFVFDNLIDGLSPSNNPVLSPLAWKAFIDTGGGNIVSGARRLVSDFASSPRVPSMVEPDAFTLGQSIATTEGAVVYRSEVFELIQYTPKTTKVSSVPILVVPPVINKFYVIDIAPGRSMVEYYLEQGQQVFAISWRNPDARHRTWGLDTYGAAIISALGITRRVAQADQTHVLSICSGGLLAAMTLGHLAAEGELSQVATFGLAVSVIDNEDAGVVGALADRRVADAAVAQSRRKGYLDGRTLAEVFAWLRPNDLIWNYWVNNYLQGKAPAAFDVLFWNADTTRMPAALHADFVSLALENSLVKPGASTMLATAVDLNKVDVPSYIVAGIADHISPWQSCYRSTQLLGGESKFVLSTSGHVACMVNPPTNPKATFQTNVDNPSDPQGWLDTATQEKGSWWPDYVQWLNAHAGSEVEAPTDLGGAGLSPLAAAPGTYVLDK